MLLKKRFFVLAVMAFSIDFASAQLQKIEPLFECSSHLEDAYGVCSHITRPSADFKLRDRDLYHAQQLGTGWVRSDFDFGTVFPHGVEQPENDAVFDAVITSCKKHGTRLLPILTPHTNAGFAWQNMTPYCAYVEHVVKRYAGKINHWEVVNEVNLIHGFSKKDLSEYYAEVLKNTAQIIRKNDAKAQVVFGGLAEIDSVFLTDICSVPGVTDAFDIMNFHSYVQPEKMPSNFHRLAAVMSRQHWSKPVWLTETGYTTPPCAYSHKDFWQELVPYACRRLGLEPAKLELAIVSDPEWGVELSTESDFSYYDGFRKVKFIHCDELKCLNPKKTPFLLASYGEYFPKEYTLYVIDYVRRGGTLICPKGVPFYYDTRTWQGYKSEKPSVHDRLHLSFTYFWDEEANQLGLPEIPTWKVNAEGVDLKYTWNFSKSSSARYINNRNLENGDEFIPLLLAGTAKRQMPVAGVYRFNSDLKGNIILQTRIDEPGRSEALQAKRVARAFIIPFAYGLDKVFWYHLRAFEKDVNDRESYFGIVHKDFAPKPAYYAYETLTRMLPDGSTRPVLFTDGNRYRATWMRPDCAKITAVWSMRPGERFKVKSRKTVVYDHMGKRITQRSFELGAGVVYLVEK